MESTAASPVGIKKDVTFRMLSNTTRHAPLFNGVKDTGEVIIGNDHVSRFLRDVRARFSHGYPDMGSLEGRRIIDSVTRHRHDISVLLQLLYDPEFVFRSDAGIDRYGFHAPKQVFVAHSMYLFPGNDHIIFAGDTQLPGDRESSNRMVTGDHDDADAGALTPFDRSYRFLTRGVYHSLQSGKDQSLLNVRMVDLFHLGRDLLIRHGQNAESFIAESVSHAEEVVPLQIL